MSKKIILEESFCDKINRLTRELNVMFEKNHELEKEINLRLGKLDLKSYPKNQEKQVEKEEPERREVINIENEVLTILANSKIENMVLYLPPEKLERKLYEKVNMVLTQIGGKWNRKKGGHIFDEDPFEAIDNVLLTGQITDKKKEFQFFPTPLKIAKKICEMAEITKKCNCLEPSAGKGNIADVILSYSPKSLTVVELDKSNAGYLDGKYNQCIVGQDFLTWKTEKKFDRIVMNPPVFQKAGYETYFKSVGTP